MAKVVKIVRTLREHWKKSTFAAVLGYFAIDYAYNRHKTFLMMREYSQEALRHGQRKLPAGAKNKHITLLLNPTAGNRKAKSRLEKYGAPLLHLSGFLVSTVKTERIYEAKDLAGIIEKTNVIAVAGGDGTVFETVTGLLRREDADEAVFRYPIGVIPVGSENKFVKSLFKIQNESDIKEAKFIADSAMAIVNHKMRPADVMEIQIAENTDQKLETRVEESTPTTSAEITTPTSIPTSPTEAATTRKPFYSLVGINMGQYREAKKMSDAMPSLFGQYFRTFWSLLRVDPFVVKAQINYIPTCPGCAKCLKEQEERLAEQKRRIAEQNKSLQGSEASRSLWSRFTSIFRSRPVLADDRPEFGTDEDGTAEHSTIINPDCGLQKSICVDTSELNILVNGGGKLRVEIGNRLGRTDFMIEGLKRLKGEEPNYNTILDCSEVEICPVQSPEYFTIDNEEFEVKRVKLKVVRDRVNLFVP